MTGPTTVATTPDPPIGPSTNRSTSLTRRGWSLTGAALGLIVGSFLLGALEMLVLGVAAVALVASVALWLRFQRRPELAVSRRVRPDRLHVGSEGRIDLLVENLGTRATPLVFATDWFDEGTARRALPRAPARRRGDGARRVPDPDPPPGAVPRRPAGGRGDRPVRAGTPE